MKIILIVVALLLMVSCAPAENTVQLTATVKYNSNTLYLTNDDNFSWSDVRLYLNGFDYQLGVDKIGAGETFNTPIKEFVTGKGERFNPVSTKIMTVYIVSTEGACGFEYGQ